MPVYIITRGDDVVLATVHGFKAEGACREWAVARFGEPVVLEEATPEAIDRVAAARRAARKGAK